MVPSISLSFLQLRLIALLLLLAVVAPPVNGALPSELENVTVAYPETTDSYQPFPFSAKKMVLQEINSISDSVILKVTTTVTHWHNPLWHLLRGIVRRFHFQNEILFLTPYFFIGDGSAMECRIAGNGVNNSFCNDRCTNGGRYCAPEVPSTSAGISGKMVVEETLRRLCWDQVFHAQENGFWDYLDAFEELECWRGSLEHDARACARKAMEAANSGATYWIDQCMEQAGGLEADVENTQLQIQIERQRKLGYTADQMPLLQINNQNYHGPFQVDSMLQQVCRTYEQENGLKPIACDFCEDCEDVRHCLWYLECNGIPFDPDTFASTSWGGGSAVTEPKETTDPPVAATEHQDSNTENSAISANAPLGGDQINQRNESDQSTLEDEKEDTYFYGGIIAGLVMGLLPALYFANRASRTRRTLRSAQASAVAAVEFSEGGNFVDNIAVSMGKGRPSDEELEDLDDVDMEINNISSMMIANGAPPKLAFLPKVT